MGHHASRLHPPQVAGRIANRNRDIQNSIANSNKAEAMTRKHNLLSDIKEVLPGLFAKTHTSTGFAIPGWWKDHNAMLMLSGLIKWSRAHKDHLQPGLLLEQLKWAHYNHNLKPSTVPFRSAMDLALHLLRVLLSPNEQVYLADQRNRISISIRDLLHTDARMFDFPSAEHNRRTPEDIHAFLLSITVDEMMAVFEKKGKPHRITIYDPTVTYNAAIHTLQYGYVDWAKERTYVTLPTVLDEGAVGAAIEFMHSQNIDQHHRVTFRFHDPVEVAIQDFQLDDEDRAIA